MAGAHTHARRRGHWASFNDLVGLWVDLFKRHNLLTYASAIAFQTSVAVVALLLLVLGVQALIFAEYLRTFANYKTAAGSLLGIYSVTTFLYVAAIILMVGVELDEHQREDVAKGEERGILELVRDVL